MGASSKMGGGGQRGKNLDSCNRTNNNNNNNNKKKTTWKINGE